LGLGLWGAPPQGGPPLQRAGVCARCHVAQVLEWTVAARHVGAGTTCQACHGPSAGHVANERNQVKPDRLPQGEAAFTGLCASCHTAGCPKTAKKAECASCHHPHALTNPNERELRQAEAAEAPEVVAYRRGMEEGERAVAGRQWERAREAFGAALRARAGDRRAAARLRMAERRLRPGMAGLEIVGEEFDGESGLPMRVRVAGLGMEMVLVPGGEWDMGAEEWRASRPVHSVYSEPYYLGKYEVTQGEWEALGMENPSPVKGKQLPVYGISWEEARAWVAKLNARTGGAFRLPTEAEWERGARETGGGELRERAWYRENSAVGAAAGGFREAGAYAPRAVGQKRANGLGLFDMQGNVAEWCATLLRPYPYDGRDGREEPGAAGLRVVRGGAFGDSAESLGPAFRHGERPGRRSAWTGLRLAR
jgi:formylglycine-generating enzyme required for sulfatase activity